MSETCPLAELQEEAVQSLGSVPGRVEQPEQPGFEPRCPGTHLQACARCGWIHLMAEGPMPGEGVSPEEELKRDVICQGEAEQPLKGPVGNPGITVSISDVCLPGSSGFDWRAGT
ncbi:hypothetical protein DUI87_29486 [Hirundo rustica rustica]|uniref:Uncharacterized protein n=1 Tax=Hirundo rustica rustica TaxID=333673 RepID=A0A3M0J583_HIRRU|nr:hypothetical protein DUI87_29486 [Hirundo rustica rustica]